MAIVRLNTRIITRLNTRTITDGLGGGGASGNVLTIGGNGGGNVRGFDAGVFGALNPNTAEGGTVTGLWASFGAPNQVLRFDGGQQGTTTQFSVDIDGDPNGANTYTWDGVRYGRADTGFATWIWMDANIGLEPAVVITALN